MFLIYLLSFISLRIPWVFPIDATTNGIGSLSVGKLFHELQNGN